MTDIQRILCIGSYRLPSNALLRTRAFARLGYSVESVDSTFRGMRLRRISPLLAQTVTRWVLNRRIRRLLAHFQPDLVFFEKNLWMTPADLDSLRKLGKDGMKLVHYNPDDPFGEFSAVWSHFIETIPCYDVHFVPKAENVTEYEGRGGKRVYPFDRSFDLEMNKPVELGPDDKEVYGCPVGFIGSWAVHREEMIARLVREGIPVAIWGKNWEKGRYWDELKEHWRGPPRLGEDYTKAICGMEIALHFLRRENRDLQDSRTFEIPACGTFMLAERTPDHERLFRDGQEAVFFDDFDDLFEKTNFYMNHENIRQQIAKAGRSRCLESGYSHDCRMKGLISLIEETK
ncbi:glycosyltransferase [Puniceicoccales bacterium CK1056]|uniref:Glycosyltransferase n=1 Tax=Oceanipulchritudo coccoides TaxID=2706888 RepID=A0A6B2M491_9BACT|nr:glycosyltransferase [Oceanipulchritudo coccoides]NDV63039.1 glycosyltransferase [Oceanipulchritudo coccoides]